MSYGTHALTRSHADARRGSDRDFFEVY